MKRLTGFIFGIIAGFIGCIAAIVGCFKFLDSHHCEDISYTFVDWLKRSIHKLLWGTYPERKVQYNKNPNYNAYSSSYQYAARRRNDIRAIVFGTKEEAEKAKEQIIDRLNNFGVITIEEVLDILGSADKKYLDHKFGWYESGCELDSIQVCGVPYNDIWYLLMPYPVKIESGVGYKEELIKSLYNAGYSAKDIANKLDISEASVRKQCI